MTPTNIQVPTRALTLWPEWAWAIHHLDKRVENRGWKIPKGEWFALHAGKSVGGQAGAATESDALYSLTDMALQAGWSHNLIGPPGGSWSLLFWRAGHPSTTAHDPRCEMGSANPVRTSAILGLFRVTDHLPPEARAPWKVPGQIGNVFEYASLSAPVPCKGAQGLWRLTPAQRADLALAMGSTP